MKMRLFLVGFFPFCAHAIDLAPGDATALPPGLEIVRVALSYSKSEGFYRDGEKQNDSGFDVALMQVRYGRSFSVGQYPALFYAEVPLGQTRSSSVRFPATDPNGLPIPGDTGVGDLAMLFALWPYANQDTGRYLALGTYLILPTGQYDNSTLSLGQNRTRFAVQAAYQQQLTPALLWMSAADVLWFGDNDDFGPIGARLEQKPLYSVQTGVRYRLSPKQSLFGIYYYDQGGTQRVNGVDLNNKRQAHRYQVGLDTQFSFGNLGLHYSADLETENGFKQTGRLQLRYLKIF